MAKSLTICVYCGGKSGSDPAYIQAAQELGAEIAKRHYALTYGGGGNGLMGAVSNAVMQGGGEVMGVIPEFLIRWEVANKNISRQIITETMHERKQITFNSADAFVFLPGGIGTLDEFFETLAWHSLKLHDKPMILLNIENYWQPLWNLLNHVKDNGFFHNNSTMPTMVSSVSDAFTIIEEKCNG